MIFQRYFAHQLSHPTGIIGKFILGPMWNKRNAKLNDATFAQLELDKEDRALDIGFGGGYLLNKIISKVMHGFVAGIDVSADLAENCQARYREQITAGRVNIQCGCAERLPYPDECFTKVSSVNSIFYWSDIEQGFAEIYRVLQANGQVVLTYTCKKDLEKKGFAQYGVRTYEEEEVQKLLIKAGFQEIKGIRNRDRHREFMCVTARK